MKQLTQALCFIALLTNIAGARAHDFVSNQARDTFHQQEAETPLKENGFNPEKAEDIVAALASDDIWVQSSAIALAKQKNLKQALPALRSLFASTKSNGRKIMVAEVLSALGEESATWLPTVLPLLKDDDPIVQIDAARLLALNHFPQGWAVIKENLVSTNYTRVSNAAFAAPLFIGLKAPESGHEIPVFNTVLKAFKGATGINQTAMVPALIKSANFEDIESIRQLAATLPPEEAYSKQHLLKLAHRFEVQQQVQDLEKKLSAGKENAPSFNKQKLHDEMKRIEERLLGPDDSAPQ